MQRLQDWLPLWLDRTGRREYDPGGTISETSQSEMDIMRGPAHRGDFCGATLRILQKIEKKQKIDGLANCDSVSCIYVSSVYLFSQVQENTCMQLCTPIFNALSPNILQSLASHRAVHPIDRSMTAVSIVEEEDIICSVPSWVRLTTHLHFWCQHLSFACLGVDSVVFSALVHKPINLFALQYKLTRSSPNMPEEPAGGNESDSSWGAHS